ncbi:MAG: nuclear transport factor 2 family protein [Pseudomonadota bacterium]
MRVFLIGLLVGLGLISTTAAQSQETPVFDTYFTLFETLSADHLPLTEDVTFDGTLLSDTIVGRENVVSFLNRAVPSLGIQSVAIQQRFETADGACAELIFTYETRGTVEYAHCLEIEDGEISAIRLYFDPRPFLNE